MNAFDYAVLGILGISVLISVLRGAVREVMALGAWIGAFWVANAYSAKVAPMLPESIPSEALRLLAAFVILFLGALLLLSLVTIAASELVKTVGLSAVDRGLGALFGLARGLLIVLVLVLLAGLTSLPRQNFWRNATFSAPLEALVAYLQPWLPEALSKRLNYE